MKIGNLKHSDPPKFRNHQHAAGVSIPLAVGQILDSPRRTAEGDLIHLGARRVLDLVLVVGDGCEGDGPASDSAAVIHPDDQDASLAHTMCRVTSKIPIDSSSPCQTG